jgi:nucleoside-diphosphate-sugar epimerase
MGKDRIFVTGATGYLGAATVANLLKRDFEVLGLARSDESARKLESTGASATRGNLNDPDTLIHSCREADGVVHIGMQWGSDSGEIDARAVAAMLDALAGTGKTFLYTSGVWVMGSTGGRLAGEMFPLKPPPAVAWRPRVERMVQDAVERKIRSIVLRPAMVYGHGGGALGRVAAGALPMIGDGENHWSFVHVDDLGVLYVDALERAPAGELYVAAAGQPLKWKDLAAAAGNTSRISIDEARQSIGPLADCYILDQKIGSTKAGRQLGWVPKGPSPMQVLQGLE